MFLRASLLRLLRLASLGAVLGGCHATVNHKLSFDPAEPLRVAVLPFSTRTQDGSYKNEESRLIVDNLSLISAEQNETPSQIVRRLTFGELEQTGLDVISAGLIDIDLPHHGFALRNGGLDLEKLRKSDPKEICTKFLDCDAVLFGTVTEWSRSYYAIQSVNTVGIEYKLVSARDGAVLFSSDAEDSDTRGLTKGPTGFSSIVVEPIQGLDSKIIVELARSVVHRALEPLRLDSRPEYLNTNPPGIFAASHGAIDRPAETGHPLIVVLYGTPNQAASFAVEDVAEGVPMIERSPGHYYGEYAALPGDALSGKAVTVSLTDSFGRVANQTLSSRIR